MTFGRRTTPPEVRYTPQRLRPLPDRLAYALRHEQDGSLRAAVLRRLYRNLTPAQKGLCDSWSGLRLAAC